MAVEAMEALRELSQQELTAGELFQLSQPAEALKVRIEKALERKERPN